MNNERPIAPHRFYYDDSDSEYDTDVEEDDEYNSRPNVKTTKQKIQSSILSMFDSDDED